MTLTPAYLTGFEYGLASAAGGDTTGGTGGIFDAQGGSPTVVAGSKRNGNYGLHIEAPYNVAHYVRKYGFNNNKFITRFAVKVTAVPVSGQGNYADLWSGSATNCKLRVGYDGRIQILAASAQQTGPVINDGNWHVVEARWYVGAVAWTADWKVDGILQTPISVSYGVASNGQIILGNLSTGYGAITFDMDDLIYGSWTDVGDWWGDGYVEALLPTMDGSGSSAHTASGTGGGR